MQTQQSQNRTENLTRPPKNQGKINADSGFYFNWNTAGNDEKSMDWEEFWFNFAINKIVSSHHIFLLRKSDVT